AAAALLVARAEAVQDLAAEPGLTDVDAGQRPGAAVLAAATSAAVAEDAVVLAAAGPGGGDVGADPLRGARGLRTDAAAAVEIARADVTRLNAERRAERAGAVLAKAGATAAGAAIGRAGARVAGGQAGRVERLALAVRARAAATGRRAGASGAVGGAAGRARADSAGTLKIAAVGVHPARAPGAAAGRDPRCAGPGAGIAQLGAAIGVGRAGGAKRCALDRGAARARLTTLTAGRAPLAAARARLTVGPGARGRSPSPSRTVRPRGATARPPMTPVSPLAARAPRVAATSGPQKSESGYDTKPADSAVRGAHANPEPPGERNGSRRRPEKN